jgi:hypothetical protein
MPGGATEDRIVSIFCRVTQGGQGRNILSRCHQRFHQNNIANVNDPLLMSEKMFSDSVTRSYGSLVSVMNVTTQFPLGPSFYTVFAVVDTPDE